jgi:hypothetical protein
MDVGIVWDWNGSFSGRNAVPEIANAGIPIPIEQNVIGGQIAMDDSLRVETSHHKDNNDNNSRHSSFP